MKICSVGTECDVDRGCAVLWLERLTIYSSYHNHLFGIDYDCLTRELRIFLHFAEELDGKSIRITDLIIPFEKDTCLSVIIAKKAHRASIELKLTGEVPPGDLAVLVANGMQQRSSD